MALPRSQGVKIALAFKILTDRIFDENQNIQVYNLESFPEALFFV